MAGHFSKWLGRNKPGLKDSVILILTGILSCNPGTRETGRESFNGIPSPPRNPITQEGVAFGKMLFESALLSKDGTQSCRSCHHPDSGFSSRLKSRLLPDKPQREIPSLWNLAWSNAFFWDGREENLESLVLKPIQNPSEMNLNLKEVVFNVNRDPVLLKAGMEAFGVNRLETRHLARGLSQYIRSLVRQPAIPESRGKDLFYRHCSKCHSGRSFSDFVVRKSVIGSSGSDSGAFFLRKKVNEIYFFKTPGLAEIIKTAPYLHDGSVPDLDSLVRMYGQKLAAPELKEYRNRIDLVNFLKKL